MNIVVNLHGNSCTVTLADTEAAGKNYVILDVVLLNCALDHFYDRVRALEMTGGTDTNLNDKHILYLRQDLVCEELAYGCGSYRVERVVNGNANTLLAVAEAEGATKLYLITYVVLLDQLLKLLYHLTGSLDMAGDRKSVV